MSGTMREARRGFAMCAVSAACVLAAALIGASGCGESSGGESAAGDATKPIVTTSTQIEMVLLPGGSFTMGSDRGGADESPRHAVAVSAFAIDRYEMTQDVYTRFEMPNPSQFKDPRRPVEQVRWSDAALFCNERSRREGLEPCYDEATFACNFEANGYRLPTEAEWEYAARAGDETDAGSGGAARSLSSHACYAGNSLKKTDPVGQRRANAWGIHDMLGNVAEWCHDRYGAGYYAQSPAADPRGPDDGNKCVMRGGAWNTDEAGCRFSVRYAEVPGTTDACFARNTFGFRCVRKLSPDELSRVAAAPASN